MPMQFLTATESPTGLQFSVWLDTTKTLTDGKTPDPAYVRSYAFGPAPKRWAGATLDGASYTTWAEYCTAEVQLLAAAELAAMWPPTPAPTPLAVAGARF